MIASFPNQPHVTFVSSNTQQANSGYIEEYPLPLFRRIDKQRNSKRNNDNNRFHVPYFRIMNFARLLHANSGTKGLGSKKAKIDVIFPNLTSKTSAIGTVPL